MATLILGVVDGTHSNGPITLGELAHILESEYSIFGTFWEQNAAKIMDLLLEEFARDTEYGRDFTGKSSMQKIKTMFTEYLDKEEHGIKTKAALLGISSRHKAGEIGTSRQSFIDSGDYRGSFIGWVENAG